jgi:hypothetical protein
LLHLFPVIADQLAQRDDDLTKLVEFLRRTTGSGGQLHEFNGNDVTGTVRVIKDSQHDANEPNTMPDLDVANCSRPPCLQEQPASDGYVNHGRKMSPGLNLTDDHSIAVDDDANRNDDRSDLQPSASRGRDNASGTTALDSTDDGRLVTPRFDVFLQVAHSLHYVSIVILGVLLLEAGDQTNVFDC